MKKVLSLLMMLALLMSGCACALAADDAAGQVKNADPSVLYYDRNGQSAQANTFPSKDTPVMLSKTFSPTGTENVFDVELKISTTQNIHELSSTSPDAATLLIMDVSNSMEYCAHCDSQNSHRYTDHAYESRLSAVKTAAKNLIDEFAALGAQDDGKRYVALVTFSQSAATQLDWTDVTNAANRERAKQIIDGLGNSSGTNIEAGMLLGANVWNSQTVSAIDYKYTILLSDGNPTAYVTDSNSKPDRDKITGTTENGYATSLNTVKDIGKLADRILGLSSLSKLYSICFGYNVASSEPFGNWATADPATTSDMTILEWMEAFSTEAFEAEVI